MRRSVVRLLSGFWKPPPVKNEPTLSYAPGSVERAAVQRELDLLRANVEELPCVIGGKLVRTGKVSRQLNPSDHKSHVCTFHEGTEETFNAAADAAVAAQTRWCRTHFETRASVFLRAAEFASTLPWRAKLIAALMLGQGKTVWQAEIDVCEIIDFWRFSVAFAHELYSQQPSLHSAGVWNRMEVRSLEGFVLAIAPFNFLAIATNLACSPAVVGNVAVLKPSSTAVLSAHVAMRVLHAAGLPGGVINLVPGDGPVCSRALVPRRDLAGVHFTGSCAAFAAVWKLVADNLRPYVSYPRMVGETGGKNFHFVMPDCDDLDTVVACTVRGAFDYSGQKCSATSRLYCPASLWPQLRTKLAAAVKAIKVGDVTDFSVFTGPVIDAPSFARLRRALHHALAEPGAELVAQAGETSDRVGYFVAPTVVASPNPGCDLFVEEYFGPLLGVHVYQDAEVDATLDIVDRTGKYALTGSVFGRSRDTLEAVSERLSWAAGNFYINDKCTGSIVGQQPFGGGRASGTNDKSGSVFNLHRWVSMRSVKEQLAPQREWRYPSMGPE